MAPRAALVQMCCRVATASVSLWRDFPARQDLSLARGSGPELPRPVALRQRRAPFRRNTSAAPRDTFQVPREPAANSADAPLPTHLPLPRHLDRAVASPNRAVALRTLVERPSSPTPRSPVATRI